MKIREIMDERIRRKKGARGQRSECRIKRSFFYRTVQGIRTYYTQTNINIQNRRAHSIK